MRYWYFIFFCSLVVINTALAAKSPKIVGQKTLTTPAGQPLTISLTDLSVEEEKDEDEAGYPAGYTLEVFKGDHYSVSGQTVTPLPGFTGMLFVPVRVRKEDDKSKKYDLQILVVADENVPPTITGQAALSTPENTATTLQLTHLTVTDPDNTYPTGFTLAVSQGANYTVSGTTVTPSAGFAGDLSVPVTVNDGTSDSNLFNVVITVEPHVNVAPAITGQVTLSTPANTAVTIQLTHLTVNDPDNTFPTGYTLTVSAGTNYTVSGTTVTPEAGFSGDLSIPVTVNDGTSDSAPFNLVITVNPAVNVAPRITGQVALSTPENTPVTLHLTQLSVSDPDNAYPAGFTLSVSAGENYSVNETTVTPAGGFSGMLSVPVTVNDGTSDSAPFAFKIDVIDPGELQIIGQAPLAVREDSSLTVQLADLSVNDSRNLYPAGFSLTVLPGEKYTANGTMVIPAANFSGNLTVGVTVSNGSETSNPFNLLIVVTPVNDPPEITQLETSSLMYAVGSGPQAVSETLVVTDVDDEYLLLADIRFQAESYQSGMDELVFQNTENIRGVFDAQEGILSLIGHAPLSEYTVALRSVRYNFNNAGDTIPSTDNKPLYLTLNDGKNVSGQYERQIAFAEDSGLDIPNAFTPNNDHANDTWKITPLKDGTWFNTAVVRVYTTRGILVYQATGFDREWDGRLNGDVLPPDTYFYTIEVSLPYVKTKYKGIVAILR